MSIAIIQGWLQIAIGLVPILFAGFLYRFWAVLVLGYRLKADGTHPDYEDLCISLDKYDIADIVFRKRYVDYADNQMGASLEWLADAEIARDSAKKVLNSVDNVNKEKNIRNLAFREMKDAADSVTKYADLMEWYMRQIDRARKFEVEGMVNPLDPLPLAPMATAHHHFHPKASLTALLHASKYPSSVILGCLLGPLPSTDNSKEPVEYLQAIPLLHHWTGLSFALEAGLQLIEEYCKLKEWTILGFYYASDSLAAEGADQVSLQPIVVKRLIEVIEGQKIASKGKERQSDVGYTPVIFSLNNRHLSSPEQAFIQIYPNSAPSPKFTYVNTPSSSASPTRLPSLLKTKQHMKVTDWDEHLEDLGARWLDNGDVELELSELEIERNVQLKKSVPV